MQSYPTHPLLQQRRQRLWRKPTLQRGPDKDDLPARTGQESRAHVVFARVCQWPAADLRDRASLGDVTGAGAHWGAKTIVENLLDGKVNVKIGLLA